MGEIKNIAAEFVLIRPCPPSSDRGKLPRNHPISAHSPTRGTPAEQLTGGCPTQEATGSRRLKVTLEPEDTIFGLQDEVEEGELVGISHPGLTPH
jgi:hypothetical protein